MAENRMLLAAIAFAILITLQGFSTLVDADCRPMSFRSLCIKDRGQHVTIENTKISLTIEKSKARIDYMYYNHRNYSKTNLAAGTGYYLGNTSPGGRRGLSGPGNAKMVIVEQSANRIDLAFITDDPKMFPTRLENHYVLERDLPGFYYYTVHNYSDSMPDGVRIGGLRYAIRTNEAVFKYYNVDGVRKGRFPVSKDLSEGQILQDSTYRFKDGTVYSKYQQISAMEGDKSLQGIYDDHLGLNLIQPSKEYVSSGPFKQQLTVHAGGPMILFGEHGGHYGTPELVPTKGWNKVYGPVLFYFNEGPNPEAMYQDALKRLDEEVGKWPYQWCKHPFYSLGRRGTVTGKLAISDGTSPQGTWLILTDPRVTDFQLESLTYMYSTQAAADGSFTIKGVREGSYTLNAVQRGVVGQFSLPNIAVVKGRETNLGTVTWAPESHGKEIWRVGIPDRSAGEFGSPRGEPSRVPNLEPFRLYGTWINYPIDYPNDVTYEVGRSSNSDWCYFQPMIRTPGYDGQRKLPLDWTATVFRIKFPYDGSRSGIGTLTVGLISSSKGSLKALLNGQQIGSWNPPPGPEIDSALFRQSARGFYRHLVVQFDLNLLQNGMNEVQFTSAKPTSRYDFTRSVMYDFVRMEVKENQ